MPVIKIYIILPSTWLQLRISSKSPQRKCNVNNLWQNDKNRKWKITFNQQDQVLLQCVNDFSVIQKEERVLVTACGCSVILVKSSEGNTNSQMISSSVVCCVQRRGIYRALGSYRLCWQQSGDSQYIDCQGACKTVYVFYFPPTEVATCSPRLPFFKLRTNSGSCLNTNHKRNHKHMFYD